MKVTVVIPNYNGIEYVADCLDALRLQKGCPFRTILVDNHSTDGSYELVLEKYPEVKVIRFSGNSGFSKAVNAGIRASNTPYVILLNNDTRVLPGFVNSLVKAIEKSPGTFSVGAKMLQMKNPRLTDDAGDFYTACGWAYARGKDQPENRFRERTEIFASCGGAAIYRRNLLAKLGMFDENHFAYLEDIDIGYRARIFGYRNFFEPRARVLHAGSGCSGSRYNEFKISLAAANSVYLIYKNMTGIQKLLNLPFLLAGFFIKYLFFSRKGFGKVYLKGLVQGAEKCCSPEGRKKKVVYRSENFYHYLRIQAELLKNLIFMLKERIGEES